MAADDKTLAKRISAHNSATYTTAHKRLEAAQALVDSLDASAPDDRDRYGQCAHHALMYDQSRLDEVGYAASIIAQCERLTPTLEASSQCRGCIISSHANALFAIGERDKAASMLDGYAADVGPFYEEGHLWARVKYAESHWTLARFYAAQLDAKMSARHRQLHDQARDVLIWRSNKALEHPQVLSEAHRAWYESNLENCKESKLEVELMDLCAQRRFEEAVAGVRRFFAEGGDGSMGFARVMETIVHAMDTAGETDLLIAFAPEMEAEFRRRQHYRLLAVLLTATAKAHLRAGSTVQARRVVFELDALRAELVKDDLGPVIEALEGELSA